MTAEETILTHIEDVSYWKKEGCTDTEIAKRLGISIRAFQNAVKKNEMLTQALMETLSEDVQSERVCMGLCKRCTGYDTKVVKYYKVKEPLMEEGKPVLDGAKKQVLTEKLKRVEEIQHIPPDLDAIKFFLMNKDKNTWQIDPERIRQEKQKETELEQEMGYEKLLEEFLSEDEE